MATPEKASKPKRLAIGSYQTALCLIPDAPLCRDIDRLRALYDKAYGKWPPHINIIYPFVAIEDLPEAVDLVQSKLARLGPESRNGDIHLRLEKSGYFSHRHDDTTYIAPDDDGGSQSLKQLRRAILEDFDQDDETYRPHLTIGQSQAQDTSFRDYLLAKASLLLPIDLRVGELVVLVRERMHGQDNISSQMKIWGTVSLFRDALLKPRGFANLQEKLQTEEELSDEEELQSHSGLQSAASPSLERLQISTDSAGVRKAPATQQGVTYQFSISTALWEPVPMSLATPSKEEMPPTLAISSYNVLVDSFHPPVRDRYAILLRGVLSEPALADVLVLQEVSDDFLSYLLRQSVIRSRYPFTTHGPPDQHGIGPLASLRNIVVLSRWSFSWEWIPFDRRHKGAMVLVFDNIVKSKDTKSLPLIVAGVHLTSGLTDGAVAAKKSQLQVLIDHLSREYSENPWVIAGDFNVTTSAFTIDAALKSKSISQQTASVLSSIGTMLSDARLSDSWCIARAEIGETLTPSQYQTDFDDLYEGEQGATFDPAKNALAIEARGRGLNHRPQRYDRILFKGQDFLAVTGFNMFGFPEESVSETGDGEIEDREAEAHCGSDHWGIRSTLRIRPNSEAREPEGIDILSTPLQPRKAPSNLCDVTSLKECLATLSTFPSDEEINQRKEAFALVKNVLQQSPIQQQYDTADNKKSIIAMVVVPVGSYGLGVWSTSSDIDCLCIGSISAKIFFALACQRLRKVADLGVRILRQVKANSGTMLELDVRGIKFDLQYCPATRIAERFVQLANPILHNMHPMNFTEVLILKIYRWPEAIQLPPSDPLFDLPLLSLTKLKSFRDLDYLRRTIPDLAAFRVAHRFIRAWAEQRGIYSSKFGYLGGLHITLLLSRVCKFLSRDAGTVTAADIICTFYHHYSNFDWNSQMVFDPFFHKQLPRYHRSAREPMVILGPHTPTVNVAHTASLPSVKALVREMKRADDLLSQVDMTWRKFIGGTENENAMADLPPGASDFLQSYDSYIKINVQYWGLSLAKGSTLVGWLESRCVLLLVGMFLRSSV